MLKLKHLSPKKFTAVLAFSFFIYGVGLMIIFFLFTNWMISKKESEQFRTQSFIQAESKEKFLHLYLDNLSRSLKSIAYNPYFASYVVDNNYSNQAEFLFLTIMLEHDDYMQLRFLDSKGVEKLRFDRNRIGGYPYKQANLQDKSNRYYFKETAKLPEGKIYTSKIDYNVEHGKIVQPFVPVFRVSIPIYFKNKFKGILTINTFAKSIISLFTSAATFDISIFDQNGWLIYSRGKFYDKHINSKPINQIIPMPISKFPKQNKSYLCEHNNIFIKSIPMGSENIVIALTPSKNGLIAFGKEDYQAVTLLLLMLFISAFPLSYLLSRPTESMFRTLSSQQDKLEKLAHTLEDRVREKSEENSRKDRILIHQARLAEMGEMIGNIAHQWRHPLTRLSLLLQNIRALNNKKLLTQDKANTMLDQAKEQIFFMSETIESFKDFYNQDSDRVNFFIKDAYEKVVDIVGYNLKHNNIEISYMEDGEHFIHGNQNEFSQVLLNLVVNAKDALLSNKTNKPFIGIHCYKKSDSIIINVSDNAGGIPENIIEKIFQPYFSTKGDKGTGIGLYMVQTIIQEKFGGNISADNSDKGAVFLIEIPI